MAARALRLRPPLPALDSGPRAYVISAALVFATLLARYLAEPVFGSTHAYTPFYPAVIVVACAFGRRPAAVVATASAVLAFACFYLPGLDHRNLETALASLLLFAANSTVAIYLITALNRSLQRLAADQGRAEAAASAQAEMFRELNDRFGHHLQLVAGILALQARGEPEQKVSNALNTASERSILLARVHRELAGRKNTQVDLTPIAAKLVSSLLTSRGHPASLIRIEGPAVELPEEEVTSLAVALLECIGALLAQGPARPLRVMLESTGEATVVVLAELDEATGVSLARMADAYLLRAAVEQANGALSLVTCEGGSALQLTFPRARPASSPSGEPVAATLH